MTILRPRRLVRATTVAVTAIACAGLVWATSPARFDSDDLLPIEDLLDPTAITPPDELRDLLGGIDFVPAPAQLDPLLGDSPAGALIGLATADADMDPGVRLRAFRALEHYPDAATTAALAATVANKLSVRAGVELLYLRAAVRSLGTIGGDAAVEPISPLLNHDSVDMRADAATALGATGSKAATPLLYDRLGIETDEMVRLALSNAIRRLDDNQQ